MLRYLQVTENKPVKICDVSADVKRGAPVAVDFTDGTIGPATADIGIYLVDVAKNYDGINSMIEPTDGDFEDIKAGGKALRVNPLFGERYATTEVTAAGLARGDGLVASAGKFVKADTGKDYEFIYDGTYDDPSVGTSYIVERVERTTAE